MSRKSNRSIEIEMKTYINQEYISSINQMQEDLEVMKKNITTRNTDVYMISKNEDYRTYYITNKKVPPLNIYTISYNIDNSSRTMNSKVLKSEIAKYLCDKYLEPYGSS